MELREGNVFTMWLNASVLSSVWVELVTVINQKLVKFLADMHFFRANMHFFRADKQLVPAGLLLHYKSWICVIFILHANEGNTYTEHMHT